MREKIRLKKRRGMLFILDVTILSIITMSVLGGIISASYNRETTTEYYNLQLKAYELGNILVKSKVSSAHASPTLENYNLFFQWLGSSPRNTLARAKIENIVDTFTNNNKGLYGRVDVFQYKDGNIALIDNFSIGDLPSAYVVKYAVSFKAPIGVFSDGFYYMEVKLYA